MTLQSSGAISHVDIQDEFGGSTPIGMDEYYGAGGSGGAPASGTISMSDFYGLSNTVAWSAWNPTSNSYTGYTGPDIAIQGWGNNDETAAHLLRLTDSLLICIHASGSSDNLYATARIISGETVDSVGSSVTLVTDSSAALYSKAVKCDRISDTHFVVSYATSIINRYIQICSVSGTTITMGTAYQISSSLSGQADVLYLNGSLVVMYPNSTPNTTFQAFSFSGTTITGAGTAIVTSIFGLYTNALVQTATDECIGNCYDNSKGYAYLLSVSGTTLTLLDSDDTLDNFGCFGMALGTDICGLTSIPSYSWDYTGVSTTADNISHTDTNTSVHMYGWPMDKHPLESNQIAIIEEGDSGYAKIVIYAPTATSLGTAINQSGNFRAHSSSAYILASCALSDRVLALLRSDGAGGTEIIIVPSYP